MMTGWKKYFFSENKKNFFFTTSNNVASTTTISITKTNSRNFNSNFTTEIITEKTISPKISVTTVKSISNTTFEIFLFNSSTIKRSLKTLNLTSYSYKESCNESSLALTTFLISLPGVFVHFICILLIFKTLKYIF